MTTKTRWTIAAGLGLFLMSGCNGSVTTDPTGSGGSVSTTTGGTGMTTTGGTTSTGSGGICSGFEDAKSERAINVRFHNDSGLPVYLPVQCAGVQYTIKPTSGDDGVNYTFDPACLQTCVDLQTQSQIQCGACAPTSYLIPAGGTREIVWNGTGLKAGIAMPAACYLQPQGDGCQQIVGAAPGKYGITAFGFASCGADCTCDAQGICNGSGEGTQAQADAVTLDFPGGGAVDVVFGVCAFGCAGEGSP